jgi:hypothetical protein
MSESAIMRRIVKDYSICKWPFHKSIKGSGSEIALHYMKSKIILVGDESLSVWDCEACLKVKLHFRILSSHQVSLVSAIDLHSLDAVAHLTVDPGPGLT